VSRIAVAATAPFGADILERLAATYNYEITGRVAIIPLLSRVPLPCTFVHAIDRFGSDSTDLAKATRPFLSAMPSNSDLGDGALE